MTMRRAPSQPQAKQARPRRWRLAALVLLSALAGAQGCASLSNPTANGIPVRRLSPEQLGESRENMQTIPLSLLRQPPPAGYRLAPGDVLGVWIEGVLGAKGEPPPVRLGDPKTESAALGFPIPVRTDGTISLPLVRPIKVDGMTLEQAEDAIRKAYTVDKEILKKKAGEERIIVTLQRRREYHILVIRQDAGESASGGGGVASSTRTTGFIINFGGGSRGARRGTGYAIDLPAYENDVLNALARTGGFPGSDAVNEVIVERGSFRGERGREDLMNNWRNGGHGPDLPSANNEGGPAASLGPPMTLDARPQRIRIPLRYRPGHPPEVRPEDVVLQTGDIVFIEAREADVFYTGGLLPSGEYVLPRDTDLDVVEAIARVGGPITSGGLNTANISGTLLPPGIGFPSPTLVSIIRKTPSGQQYTIRVDLDRAQRDIRERILIQPRDLILLQERPEEAIARYIAQAFNFNFTYTFVNNAHALGTSGFIGPHP
jgi:protein involved in polysaccharide export with SLBB domain